MLDVIILYSIGRELKKGVGKVSLMVCLRDLEAGEDVQG